MYKLTVQSFFSAAHRLDFYAGECQRVHGHNWKVEITVAGRELDQLGMVIDLMVLQSMLKECLQQFDHRMLNEVPPFDKINPTSENLARYIFDCLKAKLPSNVSVKEVKVFETEQLSVSYCEDAGDRQ